MGIRKKCLIITLLCFSSLMHASEFMFKHLEVKDGLSNNQVLDIFKDSEGFMWFATASGLNRYDGCQMTLFRSNNADPASLPDNYIKSIQEDYKGNLWILTGVGYVIYNSESETFDREVHAWLCEVGIDGTPALVYIDHNKNMWFYIKGKGCYLYIPESQLLYPLLFDTHQLPEGDITDIVECSKGILLVYNTGRLVCLDTRTNEIKWQQDDLVGELGTDKQGIFTLFVDRDNDIWMYSPLGIWVYNPEQEKWLSWLTNIIKRRSHNMVRAVSQDKQGRIWIGTDQDGIDILDKKTGEVRQLRNKTGDERSLQNNTVMVLYEDSSETMWVGTYKKGISYFNECAFKFGAEYIGDISCIEEDKEGYVWLGTNDVGIIYWNSVTGNWAAFPQKGTDKLTTDAIVCILKADDGKLWIGTFGGGLICYDNGRIIHYKKNIPERQNSLAHNNVLALAEDKQGIIWIGTLGGGVQSLNPKTGLFTTYNTTSAGLISDYVSSLCMGKEGSLWIGTAQGLSELDIETKKVVNLEGTKSGKEYFSDQNISQVYEDSRGLIWIGTCEGLNVYNPKTDELIILGVEQGVSSPIISGIVEDGNENIWVTTARGITNVIPAVDLKTGRYIFHSCVYDDKDGLQNSGFNLHSIKKLSSGEILMGGLYGINRFRPDDIKYNKKRPSVMFTRLFLFNEEVGVGEEYEGRVILDKALNKVDQIKLSYEQNMFSVQFASDNYILPEKTEYAYKLEGFNEGWMTTAFGKVTYTNLAPGTYMLKVKAVNSDGYGGDEEASLKIVIYPPFWRSVWAYVVYSLLLVAVLILGRYWILRGERDKFKKQQIKQEIERNQEKADMKLKFFTHVGHELRTPLTLIISPLETLMKEYQSDAALMDKLNIVQRNALRLLNLVNQLLDFRKIDVNGYYLSLSDDDIISCIHTICYSFISLSEKKDISLIFHSAVPSLNMLFDGDKMREVMMNLLSNALKFTCNGGRVDVSVGLVEGQDSREMLEIRVADTGVGIKEENRERIFERFYQVDNPDMNISDGGGGLSIVRDFVTLHDGTVNVMDNTPVGCVFVIHIPVKRSESKPTKIEQVQVTDKPVEDISTLQIPEFYMASNAGEESEEEPNHIITIEGLEEDIRRLESGNTEEIAEEKNIETISAVAPQRATVIQLIEGEDNEMITHIIPPEELPEMVTAVPEEKSEQKLKTVWNHAYIDFKPSGTAITSMDEKLINHAVKYVEDNIARSDLSVEELSKELGMSRVHLYKKLLAITGKTPIEFIRIIRLQRAAQLLRGSQQNISEIAYQVGFNNPKYFSRYFKEEFGILPSAFQYRQGR